MQNTKEHIANNKLVPQLRFKEFDGDCSERVYNELVKIIDCKHRTPPYVEEGIPLVSPGTIKWGEIDLISPKKRVSDEEYESLMDHCSPAIGDMVFSRNQSIGVASYLKNEEKFVLGQDTVLIQSKEIDSGYNYYRLQTYLVQCLIDRLSGGSTFARINLSDLRKLKITVADDLPEQQKIASFLSVVDEKIQQLTKKKALLEQYKKGVMQQLFSGQIRFKDENGNPYPDWEEKRLGDVCEMTSSKRVYLSDYVQDGIPFYRGKEISELRLNQTPSDILYITEERYNDYKSKYGVPKKDDILVTAVGTLGNIFRIRNNDPFYFKDGNLIWFRKIEESPYYLEILLQWNTRELLKTSIGSTQKALTMVELRKLKFDFPSQPEQQKIAIYLSSIDTKIESVNTQITQTQTFKKGLLQQMFVAA
tara:strand:- start:2833 stop:4092 length:1260 start_codon:yes stop_codon:yes gene_type:complete